MYRNAKDFVGPHFQMADVASIESTGPLSSVRNESRLAFKDGGTGPWMETNNDFFLTITLWAITLSFTLLLQKHN